MPIWCKLLKQAAERPDSFARPSTGKSNAAKIPIIAMTTNNSINVNAPTPQSDPDGSSIPKGLCNKAQGSSFLATLGFVAESLWDSAFGATHSKMRVRSSGSPALSPTTLADKTLRFMHSGLWTLDIGLWTHSSPAPEERTAFHGSLHFLQ